MGIVKAGNAIPASGGNQIVAMTFSSMAIGVGRQLISIVVRQGGTARGGRGQVHDQRRRVGADDERRGGDGGTDPGRDGHRRLPQADPASVHARRGADHRAIG